ncbi:serine/arginine repetitive matrix protein 1 isoform X2 [Linepithema humile]|uniref:serine/arginine repetitive matrix protein 1 isoform X2 n=1 Tax=Linepithema humile TaxID=83485 RepID=UPI0006238A5D|nr:PREDICTED: serine/arginine repetitive matrix protein 1-like isoform X2 [Linepithema humile]
MNSMNDKEDHNQKNTQQSEKMETSGKIYVKPPQEMLKDSSSKDDGQRASEGPREMPDEELRFIKELVDDDFMQGLDVLDAWEGDEDKSHENEQNVTDTVKQNQKPSREHHHAEPKGSHSRDKSKREEKKREETRRDPLKSTKDIERDKIRTKRDTESKLLAEKEKAIKHLLDSDNVVPPGTETEAIQSIKEEQNRERAQREAQRSKEHRRSIDRYNRPSPRRRTPDRSRLSPHRRRSPFISPERRKSPFKTNIERHRSPLRYSPGRRKNSPRYFSDRRSPILSPDRRRSPRRLSRERRSSADRRWSAERHRRRIDMHERRRSRSRDRRSRSTERLRRRSSRSPVSRRYSPRHRSRTRSRSVEKRPRKRSPFINELARQLRDGAMKPTGVNTGGYVPSATMEEIFAPILNASEFNQEAEPRPPPSVASSYVHQPGPLPPPPPPPPAASSMLPMAGGPSFMNFEPIPPMNFEPIPPPHTLPPAEYSSGPVMYNQPSSVPVQAPPPPPPPTIRSSLLSTPVPPPQPVPAPIMDHTQMPYNPSHGMPSVRQSPIHQFESSSKSSNHSAAPSTSSQSYTERGSSTSYNEFRAPREERMKTPEPPVISKPKQFEKTSLSSLLEASVSAKDPSNIPVLYPGFKPEIMQLCDQALCQLPFEDPRLIMKGRFFYNRVDEDNEKNDPEDHTSNSMLLQKGKTKIYWEENNVEQQVPVPKTTTQTHQKICQTDEVETETKGVQVIVSTADFQSQVYPHELQAVKEEKRPIMDRLEWNTREAYENPSRFREVDDLRWSLNNSSQRRWNRQSSPSPRRSDEHEFHLASTDHESREMRLDSPVREAYSSREYYSHSKYSPDYHRRSAERDDFHDRRSDHSRGESPMELEDSDNETVVAEHTFQRGSDWHGRGKTLRGRSHTSRGKHPGRRSFRRNFRVNNNEETIIKT